MKPTNRILDTAKMVLEGMYMTGYPSHSDRACNTLPFKPPMCPTCGHGHKPQRGFVWLETSQIPSCMGNDKYCDECPMGSIKDDSRVGLVWVGKREFPTPEHFEAHSLHHGISIRIAKIPRGFILGKTWVMIGHPEAINTPNGKTHGVFTAYQPDKIIMPVRNETYRNRRVTAALKRRGITPILL